MRFWEDKPRIRRQINLFKVFSYLKPQKYSKTEIENKEKIYGALRNRLKDLRELDKESNNVSFGGAGKGETLTDLKSSNRLNSVFFGKRL